MHSDGESQADHVDGTSDIRTRAELGERLTALRQRSGRSLRDLAAEVGSSASTLSGWCRAERLPYPAQHEVFVSLLAAMGVEQTSGWLDAMIRVRDTRTATDVASTNPYLGLESFGSEDADRFFGRTDLTADALETFRRIRAAGEQADLVALVGASGSGKSSLLQARLRPALEEQGFVSCTFAPTSRPCERLASAVAELLDDPTQEQRLLAADPGSWGEVVRDHPSVHTSPGSPGRLLIIDPFEELFTSCEDDDQRDRFLLALASLVRPSAAGPGACAALVGVRIDFYGELVSTGRLTAALQHSQVLVGPMAVDELTEVIVEPARERGVSVDDELLAALLRDFVPAGSMSGRHDAGVLPLLSHVLAETWTYATRGRLTVADYRQAGGITGAVEQTAEHILREVGTERQDLVKQLFLRLVHVDEHLATRRAAPRTELVGIDGEAGVEELTELLDRFVAARLLTTHERTVSIAHEALLSAWPRLRRWIDEDQESLRTHRVVTDATRTWLDSGEHASALAVGVRLDAMLQRSAEGAGSLRLSHDEHRFLTQSAARREADRRAAVRATRRLRTFATVASVFGLVAGVAGVLALDARADAISARNDARSRQMAVMADRLQETDGTLAAQLAVAGYRVAPTSEARSALLGTTDGTFSTRLLGGVGPTALAVSGEGDLVAVSDAVTSTVRLVTGGPGGPVAATIELPGDGHVSYALALDPDARILAVGDTSTAITLHDVSDPTRPRQLGEAVTGPAGPIQGLAFDPTGTELAAVGLGDGVFRWDVTDAVSPRPLPTVPADEITWSVAYHPDGGQIVFGDDTGGAHLWDVSGGGSPSAMATLRTEDDRSILSVAFSPDGEVVASGSRSGQLHLWDLADPTGPLPVEGARFESWVNAISFAPDGSSLAVGSSDGAVRVYSGSDWEPVTDLTHPAGVTEARYDASSRMLVTTATDGTMRSWDLDDHLPVALGGRVWNLLFDATGSRFAAFSGTDTTLFEPTGVGTLGPIRSRLEEPVDGPAFSGGGALSPDGRLLAHGTLSGEVLLYGLSGAGEATPLGQPLEGMTTLVETIAFSADGNLVAAAGVDTDIHVWNVSDPARPVGVVVLDEPTEIVLNLAFSPRAQVLAAASADGSIYLYDLTTPGSSSLLGELAEFESEAYALAFHPDGDLLATGGTDRVVHLWDVSDPGQPQRVGDPIAGPVSRIYSLDFHPDGDLLAGAVTDGTTWMWDVEDVSSPRRHAVLGPVDSPMYTVAFAPAGDLLVASGADMRLRVWNLDETDRITAICAAVGDPLTDTEWDIYLPDRPFEPPC